MKSMALSWPVPAALAVIAGIVLAFGAAWGAVVALTALLLVGLAARTWAGRAGLLAACALLGAAGFVRQQQWQHASDALTPWLGAQVTLKGKWDGQLLHLSSPRAAVALAPKPAAVAGELTVRGRLLRPDARRVPGGFDYAFWLRSQGAGTVLVGAEVTRSLPERGVRAWFRRGLSLNLTERQSALLRAIELGERQDVAQQTLGSGQTVRDAFTRAGLAHLMALSGQNVALIVAALTWLLARVLPLPLVRWRYPALMLALLGFLWLVGPSPSVVRAVLMAELGLLALWLGRGKLDIYGVLGLAAIASLLYQSAWLFDVGFQLSFLAVLGLSVAPRVAGLLPGAWPQWLRLAVVLSPCADLATLPVVLHNFGQWPVLGFAANLLAAPLMGVLVPLGLLSGVLGPAAWLTNWVLGPLANALLWVVGIFGHGPVISWGQISLAGFALYAVFAAALLLTLYRRAPVWALGVVGLLGVSATALPPRLHPARELVYLDVGQGDSTLIRLSGFAMLIDGGGTPRGTYDVGAKTVLPALRALGVRSLNVVVATHADADHIEGLSSVVAGLPVGEIWIGQRKDDPNLNTLLRVAEQRGVKVREVRRGDGVQLKQDRLTVLWPSGQAWREADNENSVVIRLDTPTFHTAVLGDLPDPLESELGLGHLDVLKTAHHGSRFSTAEALLHETQPRDAVISVGRANTYGHPNPQVLARLKAAGVRVWRTDEVGTVRWPLPQ